MAGKKQLTSAELGEAFEQHVWHWATETMPPAVGVPVAGFAARAVVGTVQPPLIIIGGSGTGKTRLAAAVRAMSHGWRDRPATGVDPADRTLTTILRALGSAKGMPVLLDDAVVVGGRPQMADRAASIARMHADQERISLSAADGGRQQRSTAGALIMTAEMPIFRTAEKAVGSVEVILREPLDMSAFDEEGVQARARLMQQFDQWVADGTTLKPVTRPSYGLVPGSARRSVGRRPGLSSGQEAVWGGWDALLRFLIDSRALSGTRAEELLEAVGEVVVEVSEGSVAGGPGRPSRVGAETILVRLSTELLAALDAAADRRGVARAEVVRAAITAHLRG